MDLLLTGATGYIGAAVAEALAAAGHTVHALTRSDAAAGAARAAGHQVIAGDLARPDEVAAAARRADGVVWVASSHDGDVDAPAVAAVAAALAGSGRPLVYTSGIWVHGPTGDRIIDEDAALAPTPLVAWRPAVEAAVLAAPGVRAAVIRPAVVHGRGGGIVAGMVAQARREGAVRVVGAGSNRWPTVFLADLAELYVRVVERAAAGTILLAAHGRACTQLELAVAASHAGGAGGAVRCSPLDEARAVLGAYADALALDQQVDARRARELLGWLPTGPDPITALARSGSGSGTGTGTGTGTGS